MEAREGQKETYLKWKDGIHLWVVMTTGGQCEWAWVTQNSILRTQTQVWMESHSTCSWCPAWVLWHPSPALVHLSPRCSLMVHTSNLLWKQQKLPPSPPMRTLVHTHTHTQDSWWPLTNKCREEAWTKAQFPYFNSGPTQWHNFVPKFPPGSSWG